MLVSNCRFNPTVNGPIHPGHVYMCLVNEYEAHSRDSKFHFRFDDNQEAQCDRHPAKDREAYAVGMKEDMDWLGIKVDQYSSQLASQDYVHGMLLKLNKEPLKVARIYMSMTNPEIVGETMADYPYTPYLTAEKVILDFRDAIRLLIRGKDLLGEFSLYCYFCELWGLPLPHHIYMGKLTTDKYDMGVGESNGVLSKTEGAYSIKKYKEQGWKPEDILTKLRKSCLVDPKGPWSHLNVKKFPLWEE